MTHILGQVPEMLIDNETVRVKQKISENPRKYGHEPLSLMFSEMGTE